MQTTERYYSYNRYLQDTFGGKTYKVVVASGLSCPTRDGLLSKGGCAFCDVRGSSSYFGKQGRGSAISEQIRNRLPSIRERFGAKHFLAYFQSYTNTYSDIEYLKQIYQAALDEPGISGLCIGTRPDCLPGPVIDLLEELAQKTYVSLELGVQSFDNASLDWLTRGHDRQSSIDALAQLRTRAPHVQLCVHLMLGSPTDSPGAPEEAAELLNRYQVNGIKLHQLMILENTELARRWKEEPFPILTLEEYSDRIIRLIEHLSPRVYIERLYANATHNDECLAPQWSRNRWDTHNQIRDRMELKSCIQGSRFLAERLG
jgi:radical SAM protein (TIGR01212 family)